MLNLQCFNYYISGAFLDKINFVEDELRNTPDGGRSKAQTPSDTPVTLSACRKTVCSALAVIALCTAARAAEVNLPDMGSPADALLSKSDEAQIGRSIMREIRRSGSLVEDPQVRLIRSLRFARIGQLAPPRFTRQSFQQAPSAAASATRKLELIGLIERASQLDRRGGVALR